MNAISYTADARENLAAVMDRVCDDHAPVIITRNRRRAVVTVSLRDYEALEETACLLKNPRNARRILSAIAQLDGGKSMEREPDACVEKMDRSAAPASEAIAPDTERAHLAEVRRRMAHVQVGEVTPVSGEQVLAGGRALLASLLEQREAR